MKKMATIGLLATSILILTACSTTKNKENSAAAKEDTVTSQSSETKEEKVNLNGKDMFEYYNISYNKPKQLEDIVGIYPNAITTSDDSVGSVDDNLIILSDGRYITTTENVSSETNYFDKDNIMHKRTFTSESAPYQLSVTGTGRIIEKNGIYYLFDNQLGGIKFITNLDSEGNQVINEFLSTLSKNDIEKNLENVEEVNDGFIKNGKYFKTKDVRTGSAVNKAQPNSELKDILEKATFKFYEETSEKNPQYVKDMLSSQSINDLFYLTTVGREISISDREEKEGLAPEIKVLSSDELNSVEGTNKKLKYGFKVTEKDDDGKLKEFPEKAYATDGSTVYDITYDQLGVTAQEVDSLSFT
jgi:hypothetical protein